MKKKSFIEKYKELKKNDMLREEELFQNNKADIQKSNLKVLKGLMLVVVPLMIGLVFISLFFEPLNELRNIYIILLGTCMLIIVLSNICKNAKVSLACFMLTALFVGSGVRMTNLQNFEMKRQAHIGENTDFLTQLPNKRKLFPSMRKCEKNPGKKLITGVMMMDIDKFKLYNDSYGHQKGDDCLATVAA